MTCIAYKSGFLASDSAVTEDGSLCGSMIKITRAPDGSMAGACGGASSLAMFLNWVHKGRHGAKPNVAEDKDFSGLFIAPTGIVSTYEAPMYPFIMANDFYAFGSGADVAMGAMAAGVNAIKAVKIACKFNVYCSEPIYILRLDGEPHRLNPPGLQ